MAKPKARESALSLLPRLEVGNFEFQFFGKMCRVWFPEVLDNYSGGICCEENRGQKFKCCTFKGGIPTLKL
jgi:hypothetical protein